MHRNRHTSLLLVLCVTLITLAACGSDESATPTPPAPTTANTSNPTPQVTVFAGSVLTPTAVLNSPISPVGATPVVTGAAPVPAPIQAAPATLAPSPTPQPTPTLPPHPPEAIRGINVADSDPGNIAPLKDLGFTWVQTFLPPTVSLEPFKVLYRATLGDAVSGTQEDIDQFAAVIEGVAKQNGQFIDAYSIGNEVNLSREWAGQQPNPVLYAKLLAVAYARIKTYDPTAIVVSAGIAPTGGDGPGSMDDIAYAKAMLDAGAGNAMDAYGFHPYGFAYAPQQDPSDGQARNGLTFRRAELHRQLMEQYGMGDKKMWATEFGWLIEPAEENMTCSWPDLDWQKVSRDQQAQYVVQAFDYAKLNWPWMEHMFLWNYDFSRSPLYPEACEQMKWFSMLDEQGNPRPLVHALRKVS